MKTTCAIALLCATACAALDDVGGDLDSVARASFAFVAPLDSQAPQEHHFSYTGTASSPWSKYLVVVLHGGNGGHPGDYIELMEHANGLGFYVLGLSYKAPAQLLAAMCPTGLTCQAAIREEIFAGTDDPATPFVAASRANIRDRLDDALASLGWNQFRSSGHPRWSRIVLVGHGGGNVSYIAKQRGLARAVQLGGLSDGNVVNGAWTPAAWVDDASDTPGSDVFGLAHWDDPYVPLARTLQIWDLFAPGNPYCVAGICANPSCPGQTYCDSRQLTTRAAIAAGSINEHYDVARNPIYAGAWSYLLTHDLPVLP